MWLDRAYRTYDSRHRVSFDYFLPMSTAANIRKRINCRLPQTPRTPSTGMAHYFDETTQRISNRRGSISRRHFRRSSVARSIGARSDFESTNGDHDDDDDARSCTGSVYPEDPEYAKAKAEDNEHMAKYVSDQLRQYTEKTKNYENPEDLETTP